MPDAHRFPQAPDDFPAYEDKPSLPRIEVPTAIIYACDDRFVPPDAYARVRWEDNPNLIPLIVPEGGHVGFHQSDDSPPWHHVCIQHLLEHRLTGNVTAQRSL